MTRVGLAFALAVAGVVAWLFTLFPRLDLVIGRLFFDSTLNDFPARFSPLLITLRESVSWIVALLVAPAVIALVLKLLRPSAPMLVPGRAAIFLVVTLIIGPGLLVNVLLKDNWNRPRPAEVTELGGSKRFVAWWDMRGDCETNCSFVAGESAGAFWTIAPAALAPPQWQPLAYAAAIAFGSAVGLLRTAFGGHFFTDVVFSGVLTFLVIWITHSFIYRWPRTRLTDSRIEEAIERLASSLWSIARKFIDRLHTTAQQFAGRSSNDQKR